jgi:hypothetical protein
MRSLALAIALLSAGPWALANGRRALPLGEENPQMIEKLYESPVGEVQFTQVGKNGHSGFLRNSRGNLMAFEEVRGPAVCGDWFLSTKWSELPAGCEFVFYDSFDGRTLSVRSEEMKETNLFQAARGKLRGWRNYVAL